MRLVLVTRSFRDAHKASGASRKDPLYRNLIQKPCCIYFLFWGSCYMGASEPGASESSLIWSGIGSYSSYNPIGTRGILPDMPDQTKETELRDSRRKVGIVEDCFSPSVGRGAHHLGYWSPQMAAYCCTWEAWCGRRFSQASRSFFAQAASAPNHLQSLASSLGRRGHHRGHQQQCEQKRSGVQRVVLTRPAKMPRPAFKARLPSPQEGFIYLVRV